MEEKQIAEVVTYPRKVAGPSGLPVINRLSENIGIKPSEVWYNTAADEELGVFMISNDEGDTSYLIPIRDKRAAWCYMREMDGRDMNEVQKIAQKDNDLLQPAMIAKASKFYTETGEPVTLVAEDVITMKARDYNRLTTYCNELNVLGK